jgi:hypothetical protein
LKLNQNKDAGSGETRRWCLKVNKSEIIWSIPIFAVLVYLIYYGINAKKITDECLSYCYAFSKLYAWKIDGDLFGALFLDKSKMFCSCYYPCIERVVGNNVADFLNQRSWCPFANATIAKIENGGGYHN